MPRRMLSELASITRRYPAVQILALVGLGIYAFVTIPGLTSRYSIVAILVLAALLGLAAVGQTLVILMGGIDFSVAGFILLGATTTVMLTGDSGWPLVFAVLAAIVLAAFAGGLSGAISFLWNVQPLIVTLAVGTIVTGLMLVWLNGVQPPPAPQALARFSAPVTDTFGLPLPPILVVWLLVIVVVAVVMSRTSAGRRVYLFGSNARAAELALIPTARLWVGGFAISGICSAVVGVLLAGFSGTADPSMGTPYLFQSLTAVIVGGTTFGARGSYSRTALGAITLVLLSTILLGRGYTYADQQIIFGLLILLAVAAYGRDRRLTDRI